MERKSTETSVIKKYIGVKKNELPQSLEIIVNTKARPRYMGVDIIEQEKQFKVVANRDVKMGHIICIDWPILSYKDTNIGTLPLLLSFINNTEGKLNEIHKVCQKELYPHTTHDMYNSLKHTYRNNTIKDKDLAQMVEQKEHRMIAYSQNAFDSTGYANSDGMVHLYLGASKFNHSCYPNCLLSFEGNRVFICVLSNISSGEECTISYNRDVAFTNDRNTNKRKAYLKEKYNFDCDCTTCRGVTTKIIKDLILEHHKIGETSPLFRYWIKPALKSTE